MTDRIPSPVPMRDDVRVHPGPALLSGLAGGPSLTAHRSQTERSPNMRFPEVFREVFGVETFVLAHDRTASPVPEHDLFASLRGEG